MLKKIIFTLLFSTLISGAKSQENEVLPSVYSEGFKFCEGTVAYKNMILVSNFGTETLDPLNNQGKGYIMAIEGPQIKPFIRADGNLSAPKGMAVYEGHLFIADVNKVVVYNLRKLSDKPRIIKFPEEDTFVNDITVAGKMIFVSVTNTNRLYGLDASDINTIAYRKPLLLGEVPGPNGMAVYENNLYIASYNASGKPKPENVIYLVDLSKPGSPLQKLITGLPAGQYDGIQVSEDGNKLIFTSWETADNPQPAVWVYNLAAKTAAKIIDYGVPFKGPADITVKNGNLWVPDLPNSKVYRFDF